MREIQYVTSRCIVWAGCLLLCLRVFAGSDLLDSIRTGKMDWSIGVLYVYLVFTSLTQMYQMMLHQRLIQDVASTIYSLTCDLLVLMFFMVFFVTYQRMRGTEYISWDTPVIIAIALLIGNRWKRRSMEIRADRTLSHIAKSLSVHVPDKSLIITGLVFSLFLLKEVLMMVFVSVVARRPVFWNFRVWQGISIIFKGLWYNFVLDFSMITLEYFLFHPINFTQSPWAQVIPKMGVRAIKGVTLTAKNPSTTSSQIASNWSSSPKTEMSLIDCMHGLTRSFGNVSQKPFLAKQQTQSGKQLLRTVQDIYLQHMRKIVGSTKSESAWSYASTGENRAAETKEPITNALEIIGVQQFVFTSSSPSSVSSLLSSSLVATFLAPIYGFLECQAFFDLHRITRSSKLRREPLFHANYNEWLSGTLNFFLGVTLQMNELLHFVRESYDAEDFLQDIARLRQRHHSASDLSSPSSIVSKTPPIGVETILQTQGQGVGHTFNGPFTFPRSPDRRVNDLLHPSIGSSSLRTIPQESSLHLQQQAISARDASSSRFQSVLLSQIVSMWMKGSVAGSPSATAAAAAGNNASSVRSSREFAWLSFLDSVLTRGEWSMQMGAYLCLGAWYQFWGFLWQLPLRGEVASGEVTASLRQYFSRWFSSLFAQEIVNALDSTSTLLYLALAEDRSAAGVQSTGSLLAVVYVLLLFEEAIEEVIDLLHQTHTTKVSIAKALAAMPTKTGAALRPDTSASDITGLISPKKDPSASRSDSGAATSSSSTSTSTTTAVSYRRFKLKSLQLLPREIIALRRGVKEAIAKIWKAYVDILIVQDLPKELQGRALEYRRAALLSEGQ